MSRRVSNGSNGRAQTQRIVSGARVNPYSRPESTSKKVTDGSKQWPPNQLSIRGSSGPTWIIVSNLLRGTSEADIQSTFQQFGSIEAVRSHQTSTATGKSENSLSFEIAFTHSTSAQGAIDKLNGALADGRVLSVRQRDNVPVQPAAMASGSKQPPRAPAAMTAAAAAQQKTNIGKKELLPAKKSTPSLNSRILSATELKTLSKKQAKSKKAVGSMNGMLTAPGLNQVSPASASLANRIGSLPLALRLAEGNGTGKSGNKKVGLAGNSANAITPASSAQKKRKRAKAKAAAAAKSGSGMQLD